MGLFCSHSPFIIIEVGVRLSTSLSKVSSLYNNGFKRCYLPSGLLSLHPMKSFTYLFPNSKTLPKGQSSFLQACSQPLDGGVATWLGPQDENGSHHLFIYFIPRPPFSPRTQNGIHRSPQLLYLHNNPVGQV